MTQEDKQLLLRDLCARLPYGVICHTDEGDGYLCSINQTIFGTEYGLNINPLKRDYFNDSETEEQVIKPYLRPMSSMTEEEKEELQSLCDGIEIDDDGNHFHYTTIYSNAESFQNVDFDAIDWFNSHHFDYRGLIDKGLALEAPVDMYKN